MKIKMNLLSDCIFGNGSSVPGGEDIAVVHDDQGFPYYKGSTLKGIFREHLTNYLSWEQMSQDGEVSDGHIDIINKLLGDPGDVCADEGKLIFSDLKIPENVKAIILRETGNQPDKILDILTSSRTFTALTDEGIVKEGSLRTARCVNHGIWMEGELQCPEDCTDLVKTVLGMIKWVGTMRNRGFGKVILVGEEA